MTNGVLFALSVAVVYGFLGVCYEFGAKRQYLIWHKGLIMQLTGFLIGLVVRVVTGRLVFDARLLLLGALGSTNFVVGLSYYLAASRERDIAANWTIVNLSVALPFLISVVWFKDAFTLSKGLGAVVTLASIILIGGSIPSTGEGRPSPRWFVFITSAFCTNTIIPVLLRFVPGDKAALFTTHLYGVGFPSFRLVNLATNFSWDLARGLIGAAVGAAHWSGIMLNMLAVAVVGRVSHQTGLIVYPITNGLVIPIGVILGALILKQKFSLRSKNGVALGMADLALLSMP